MRSKHADELLKAAKLCAIAEGDTILAYLVEMAILHNALHVSDNRKHAALAAVA